MPVRKCYIYTRVSTAMQVDGYSLDAQLEVLREYAEFRGLVIAGEYCDAGKSGKDVRNRPSFRQMMDDVVSRKDDVECILVFKLSRFGRSSADILRSMQTLDDFGISLVSVKESVDSSTSSGRLTLSILSAVAEMEHDNITTQFLAGRSQKIMDGGWYGGACPYGYRLVDHKLVTEPHEAEIVRKMFDMFDGGMSVTSIAEEMNACGYKRMGQKSGELTAFNFDVVSVVLDNPIYCGRLCFGRRTNKKGPDGKTLKNDPSKVLVSKGNHEAIVSEELWDRVHEKRTQSHKAYVRNMMTYDRNKVNVLSGLVKCPVCGKGLVGATYGTKDKNGNRYEKTVSYYMCRYSVKQNGRICSFSRRLKQEIIDGLVLEVVGGIRFGEEFKKALQKALCVSGDKKALEKRFHEYRKELKEAESLKERLGEQLDGLDPLKSGYDRKYDLLSEKLDEAYDRIDELEALVDEMRSQLDSMRKRTDAFGDVAAFIGNIKPLLEKMDMKERKEFYSRFIDRIEVFPEDRPDGRVIRSISFKFPLQIDEKNCLSYESVSFEMDCSEMDIELPEKCGIAMKSMADGSRKVVVVKPTYGAIKEFINERFGMKISSLYIAQTKRKYGLDMGENYNLSKKANARIPNCPAEKEKMILEALKHFDLVDQRTVFKEGA